MESPSPAAQGPGQTLTWEHVMSSNDWDGSLVPLVRFATTSTTSVGCASFGQMADSKDKKRGKPAPLEMSTCAPSSSGASQKSSATMSTAETIEHVNKVLEEEETEIKEDKNGKKEDKRTESDATTYNQSDTRSSKRRGAKRMERDVKRLVAFQKAKVAQSGKHSFQL
jgi:hypothetical protein